MLNLHPGPWTLGNVDGYFVVNDADGQPVCYPAEQAEGIELVNMARKMTKLTMTREKLLLHGYDPTDVTDEQIQEISASIYLHAIYPGYVDAAVEGMDIAKLDVIDPGTEALLIRSSDPSPSGTILHINYVADTWVETRTGQRYPIQDVRRMSIRLGDDATLLAGEYRLMGGVCFMLAADVECAVTAMREDDAEQVEIALEGGHTLTVPLDRLRRKIRFGEVQF